MLRTLVLIIAVAIEAVTQQAATNQHTMPPRDSLADDVRRAILEDVSSVEPLESLIQIGPAVAEELKPYLAHPSPMARSRAMYTLSRMPRIGSEVMAVSLRSHDYDQRDCAVKYAGPLLADPEVAQTFVDCIMNEPRGSRLIERAVNLSLLPAPPTTRKQVGATLIPRVLEAMKVPPVPGSDPTAEAEWARQMVLLLGQVADPRDKQVLDALARFRAEAESRFLRPADEQRSQFEEEMRRQGDPRAKALARFIPLESVTEMRKRCDSVLNTVIFAQANLGDADALAEYVTDVLSGSPETKLARLKLLPRFNPTSGVMDLAVRLLDNKTEIEPHGPAHLPIPEFRRACDLAIDALGGWCPELKEMTRGKRIYHDREIEQARQIGKEYRARLRASSGVSPADRIVAQVFVSASRPVTQPMSRPESQPTTRPATRPANR